MCTSSPVLEVNGCKYFFTFLAFLLIILHVLYYLSFCSLPLHTCFPQEGPYSLAYSSNYEQVIWWVQTFIIIIIYHKIVCLLSHICMILFITIILDIFDIFCSIIFNLSFLQVPLNPECSILFTAAPGCCYYYTTSSTIITIT